MTGYTRADSVNNIADGNIINASDLDGEFDAVQAAFNNSTGHVHDGTAANGAPITKIGPTQDVVASAIALLPKTTATVDVGSSSLKFKDFFFSGAGSVTGTITAGGFSGTVGATTPAAGTFTSLSDSGNLTFTGTGNRITGDFTNATVASRVAFQTSTVNGNTTVNAIPNGTATSSQFITHNATDPGNSSRAGFNVGSTTALFFSDLTGTGTYLPMAFNTGGSERMRIDSSGNVGIGTSSPGYKLQVSGAIYQDNGYAQFGNYNAGGANSPVAGGISFSTNATGGQAEADVWNGNDPAIYANTGILFTQRLTSTTRRDLVFMHNNGNVGIGTNSPGAKLDVQVSGSEVLKLTATTGTNSIYQTINNTGGSFTIGRENSAGTAFGVSAYASVLFSAGAYPMVFATQNIERMRIDSSGNVGIGTNSPTVKLDVTGGIKVSGQLMAGTSGSVYSPLVSAAYVSGTSNLYLRNLSGTNRIDSYNDPITATYPLQLNASQITFYIADAEKMRIDSSGNVGIGGTPAYKLDVTSSAFIGGRLSAATGTNGVSQIYTNTGGTFSIGIDSSTGANFGAAYGGFLWHAGAYPLLFGTSNTERMRIDSSGNVGIGRTPTSGAGTLQVSYLQTIWSTSSTSMPRIQAVATDYLSLPSYKNIGMQYNDSAVAGNLVYCPTVAAANTGLIEGINVNALVITTNGSPLVFGTNGAERMRIDTSGNVGIGTNAPNAGAKLHLYSSVVSNAGILRIQHSSGSYNAGLVLLNGNSTNGGNLFIDGVGGLQLIQADNSYLVLGTNNTERARIDSSGNVLVTNPAGLGYGTGSGGTVTQATSKSTAVTLNKPTGKITMNAAAMAAGGVVEFVFNNSLATNNDLIMLTLANQTGAYGNYNLWGGTFSGGGGFYINVKNISGGSLSEALVINFAIIKGATA